jgi:hypothetical protein
VGSTYGRVDEADLFLVLRDAVVINQDQHGRNNGCKYRNTEFQGKFPVDGDHIICPSIDASTYPFTAKSEIASLVNNRLTRPEEWQEGSWLVCAHHTSTTTF